MLFEDSQTIKPGFDQYVEQLEAQEVGIKVLCAESYRLDYQYIKTDLVLSVARPLNVLEHFILKAILEFEHQPSVLELAQILGLDTLFVEGTVSKLDKLGLIKSPSGTKLQKTALGEQCYKAGIYDDIEKVQDFEMLFNEPTNTFYRGSAIPESVKEDLNLSFNYKEDYFDDEEDDDFEEVPKSQAQDYLPIVQTVLSNAKSDLHNLEKGSQVISLENVYVRKFSKEHPIFIIHDTVRVFQSETDNLAFRSINLFNNMRYIELENLLERETKGSLAKIRKRFHIPSSSDMQAQIADMTVVRPEQSVYKQEILQQHELVVSQAREQNKKVPSKELKIPSSLDILPAQVEYLFGKEIRPRFIHSLKQAKRSVIILSPWITEEVVDNEFIGLLRQLAQQNVYTIIGWGIARNPKQEDRKPSNQLLQTLEKIQTQYKLPAISVWWIGNFHNKEVIVDREIHLSGSQNWLSYRGDHLCRGESVHCLTRPDTIAKALGVLEPLIDNSITREWEKLNQNPSRNTELLRCVISWIVINKLLKAFRNSLTMFNIGRKFQPTATELFKAIENSIDNLSTKQIDLNLLLQLKEVIQENKLYRLFINQFEPVVSPILRKIIERADSKDQLLQEFSKNDPDFVKQFHLLEN